MSIHLILKNIQGDFLAQISDVAGQVTIGRGNACDLQIPDDEVNLEQLRFSYLNGELWLQVPDATETVKIEDQTVREAKINSNTVVFFKDYFIEVLFKTEETVSRSQTITSVLSNSNLTIDARPPEEPSVEATRIVDPSMEKTRVAVAQEVPSKLQFDEATRLVKFDEATRVVHSDEATRVVTPKEQSASSPRMRATMQKVAKSRSLSPSFQTNDFPAIFNSIAEDLLEKVKNVPPQHARNIGFGAGVAIFMLLILFSLKKTGTPSSTSDLSTQSLAHNDTSPRPFDTQKRTIQTVSKDIYLQELDKLFSK